MLVLGIAALLVAVARGVPAGQREGFGRVGDLGADLGLEVIGDLDAVVRHAAVVEDGAVDGVG